MFGNIKYVGEYRYQQIQCGERVLDFETGGDYKKVPLFKCKELVSKGEFVPDEETHNKLLTFGQKDPAIEIENRWEGERVFIIGSGYSLKGFDYSRLDNEKTIILNHAVIVYPKASALLFMDKQMIKKSLSYIKMFRGLVFAAYRTLYQDLDERENVHYFSVNKSGPQESFVQGLYNGKLSGLASINLSLLMGASEIYLLGYDMNPEEKSYGFDSPNNGKNYKCPDFCKTRIEMFDKYEPYKDKIFNCNKDSGVKVFEYRNIDEVLQ